MLNHILRPEGSNPGGSLSLEFCPTIGIQTFPQISSSEISTEPVFHAGFQFWRIEVIQNKLNYQCIEEDSDHGPIWRVQIDGVVRGDSATLKNQFQLMAGINAFVVKIKDNAFLTRLAGNPAERLKFSYKNLIGDTMSDLRSYSFQFKGDMSYDPPVYTA